MLAKKFNIRISWLNVSPNNNSLCMIKLQEDFNFISDRTLAAYQAYLATKKKLLFLSSKNIPKKIPPPKKKCGH